MTKQPNGKTFFARIFGEGSPQKSRTGYFGLPLAPASRKVLVIVSIATAILLMPVAALSNNIVSILGCVAVISLAAAILDYHGRKRAKHHPHPLLRNDRLPEDSKLMRIFLYCATIGVLLTYTLWVLRSNRAFSPWFCYLAVGFLFLDVPQIQGRRAIRLYNENVVDKNKSATWAAKKRKRRRRKR